MDFTQDRNSEEPHAPSALCLANVITNMSLSDVWREHNLLSRQYTWVKISNEKVSAARLDRLYVSRNMRNRVLNSTIFPTSISDHKCVTMECTLVKRMHKSYYWHFNAKLLEDEYFCEIFFFFLGVLEE